MSMKENTAIKIANFVGANTWRLASAVGQGLKWTEGKVDQITAGIARCGDYFNDLGSDCLRFRDKGVSSIGWLSVAIPLKTVGWGIKVPALFSRGVFKGSFRTAEFVGRQTGRVAHFVGKTLIEPEENSVTGPKDKLAEKAALLDKESAAAREARELAVRKAEEAGKPLTAKQVIALRKVEEQKRFEAYKREYLNGRSR